MFCILLAALSLAGPVQSVPSTDLNSAAARTVGLLQKVGGQWNQQCVSCHHQSLPLMAMGAARQHGVALDEQAAKATARPLALLGSIDFAVQGTFLIDPAVSDGYALLGAHAAGVAPSLTTAIYARRIANWQSDDGHGRTFDARPPHSSSLFSTTAIAIRAMQLYMPPQLGTERDERIGRGRGWLLSHRPQSTEDRAFQLLGLGWAGASAEDRRRAAAELVGEQRPDGGWAQVSGLESDAYSTGQALVALHQAGMQAIGSATYQRGLRYLLTTQAADGSWHVKTRLHSPAPISPPYFETGFPYGHDQVISCAGSVWAAMALMEALPQAGESSRPLPFPEVQPDAKPWMATALFGSAAELRALLDAGLNPNTATAEGTSLLMMAAADAEKVNLLLERGADAKARAKTGYTPLVVASMYRGNSQAVRALLQHGAEAMPSHKRMFNVMPLVVASLAGDTETADLLVSHGADAARPMLLVGMVPTTPLGAAVGMDDAGMARYLLAHGAKADETDANGMTELSWAALMHRTGIVRMLLNAGADPNHKDKFGYTPLRHTEDISFGDPQTAAVLQTNVRTTASR